MPFSGSHWLPEAKPFTSTMAPSAGNRPLSLAERDLARWMLENGTTEARTFLAQLELAEVTPWRCPCGCASLNFQIQGQPEAPPGVHILGDYVMGQGNQLAGAFIYSSGGLLSGIEVYGFAEDAPRALPSTENLRTFENFT